MNEFLPIGSIVLLKTGKRKYMIIGRLERQTGLKKVFDYSACGYPEGILDSKSAFLFDNTDIKDVIFEGYKDQLENRFQQYLCEKQFDIMSNDIK